MTSNITEQKQPWFAELLVKQPANCDTCTVASWGYCYHAEYGKCKHFDAKYAATSPIKSIVGGIMLLISTALSAQPQVIGYRVTIDKGARKMEEYKLDNIFLVDSLVMINFRHIETGFAALMLKDSRHFQIITNNIEFCCEKKRIVGRKRNGELILRNLRKSK